MQVKTWNDAPYNFQHNNANKHLHNMFVNIKARPDNINKTITDEMFIGIFYVRWTMRDTNK